MLYVELWGLRVNVYAQIAGFVGMAVLVWSYQLRRKGFFVVNTLAMAIFLLESCLLYADADTFTGIVLNAAAIVRNLLMLFCTVRLNCPFGRRGSCSSGYGRSAPFASARGIRGSRLFCRRFLLCARSKRIIIF